MGEYGDRISGAVGDAKQVAIGKDNQVVSVYADTHTWREAVQREGNLLHREIFELRGWVRGLLIAVCIVFFAGLVLSLLALRQFDRVDSRMEGQRQRLEYLERRAYPPVPFVPIP